MLLSSPGVLAIDTANVTFNSTGATFATRNVGSAIPVTVTGLSFSGSAGSNYSVANTNASVTTAANINKATLTLSAVSNTKTYDSTPVAAATPRVSGLQGSDTVSGLVEAYDSANAGSGKTLSVTGYTVNDGNDGNNYTVLTTPDLTGVISPVIENVTSSENPVMDIVQDALPTDSFYVNVDESLPSGDGTIRIDKDIRQQLPEVNIILSVSGIGGEGLPSGVSYNSASGELTIKQGATVPQYLTATGMDPKGRTHEIVIQLGLAHL